MKRSRLVTFILLVITAVLVVISLYVAFLLADNSSTTSAPIVSVKTKAQSKTYTRKIDFNLLTPTLTPTPTLSPTLAVTPNEFSSPTPTEVILAYNNPSPTDATSDSLEITDSPTPTKTTTLPETGYINNALIIFASATLLIFLALIF